MLPGTHFGIADITPPGHVAALSWTALSAEDTSVGGFLGIGEKDVAVDMAKGEVLVGGACGRLDDLEVDPFRRCGQLAL